jgi:hypothetical protein
MKIVDPIAQTFYVQPSTGYFVTSIDLFFYSKDPTLPVTIQLRPTVYGQPSESFYQYSEVVLTPDKILISNDGSLATRVKFDSPIYLEGENFHCICLSTNSDQYRVHISRLTEMDLLSSSMSSVFVTQQPLSGSFFNSQNGETWTAIQTDDLKFTLYRADFKNTQGDINFYNSELGIANAQIATLNQNPLEINSREIRVGLGSTLTTSTLTLGNLVSQTDSTGTGTLINVAGIASGPLKVINSGIGYTPTSGVLTYTNVPLTTLSGSGTNATATITITNGSVTSIGASISSGGNGYKIGDVVTPTTIGVSNLGANMLLSVQSITGINELILDKVQGKFEANNSNKTLYINGSGGQDLYFTGVIKAYPNNISVQKSGEYVKVNHQNHGMHSLMNKVKLSDISSDLPQTKLSSAISSTSTNIVLESSANFSTFENLPVSATNPGYLKIGSEIIAYTGVSGNTLTGVTRAIDQTLSSAYSTSDLVMKYELNGVSLRRINKIHALSETDVGLDYYNLKIDFSQAGNLSALPQGITNRSSDSTLGPLFFNQTVSSGGTKIKATQNIPFEIARPLIDAKVYPNTNIISKIKTVSGTSISGNEVSYQDKGFSEFSLFENNYFNSPRLVASKVNEDSYLSTLPGKKSLTLNLQFNTTNSYISPTIDLQRIALSFTSNRVNDLIENFELDERVSSLSNDPSAFVYACLPIQIELPANALKIYITAHINNYSEIKCLYSISNNPNDPLVYYPFPGYNNIGSNNETIDPSKNTGLPDKNYTKENVVGFKPNEINYKEYVFTVNNLPPFRYYSIKLVGTSTNQAYPPRLKDLRVIALAGDV